MMTRISSWLPVLAILSLLLVVMPTAPAQTPAEAPAAAAPAESSKPPAGINDSFTDPEIDVQSLVNRFERDGREPFAARQAILKAMDLKPGMRVADVGAGSGLFTVLFADAVGDDGWVYAVDIAPKIVGFIAERADKAGIENITPVLCDQNSVNLAPESVDVLFVCDVYHHFESPADTNRTLFRALRPGGRLVLIDFVRDPATSSEWLLNHVRAGKQTFRAELEEAGFELLAEPEVPGLTENYLLMFSKPVTLAE